MANRPTTYWDYIKVEELVSLPFPPTADRGDFLVVRGKGGKGGVTGAATDRGACGIAPCCTRREPTKAASSFYG